jgi:hypothetical protein
MPGRTKTLTLGERSIPLQRPTYLAFRPIAIKVDALMGVEFDVAMTMPDFLDVLTACIEGEPASTRELVEELDYADAAALWDAVMEHCEFTSFFAARRQRHFETSKERMETEVDLQAAQFNRMKRHGLLPESFSFSDVMTAADLPALNLTSSPPSSITTPASTDGDEATSRTRTSGSSSATSPKPRDAAKRSRG